MASSQDVVNTVSNILRREDSKQHLLTAETFQAAALSLTAFYKASTHPYVIRKVRKCAKPILIVAIVTFFMGTLLTVPIQAIARLVQVFSLGAISSQSAASFGQQWVTDAVAFAPMVTMLVVRSFIRKPLYKCFIHMLQEVNPQTARTIETTPRFRNPNQKSKTDKFAEKVDKTYQRAVDMAILSAGLYIWRQLPIIGRLAAPVMHWLTVNKTLGPRRAAIISLVALFDPVEPYVIKFVEIWRASRILGPEVLDAYLSHTVPYQHRANYLRENEVIINAFLAPQVLLLSIPVVGPIIFIPMQAATAWLVDLLVKQSRTSSQAQSVHPNAQYNGGQAVNPSAPTMPASAPVYPDHQSQQPASYQQATYQQPAYSASNSYQRPATNSASSYQQNAPPSQYY